MATPEFRGGALARDLAKIVGDSGVSVSDEDLRALERDMWPLGQLAVRFGRPLPRHEAVVWPSSIEQVASIVRYARTQGLGVIPFGAGSGVCGGTLATRPAIALDMKRMDRILELDPERLEAGAQAGILGEILERRLAERGLTLGHFPSSIHCSTLGGWLAARSAGQLSTLYGKIEDMVLGIRVVTGEGEVVEERDLDGLAPEEAPGLVLGSEGTSAVIVEATLALHRAPESREFLSAEFPSTERGVDAIRDLLQAGIVPAAVRLYDPMDSLLVGRSAHGSKSRAGTGQSMARRGGLVTALRASGFANLLVPLLSRRVLLVLTFEGPLEIARATTAVAEERIRHARGRILGPEPARQWWLHRYDVSHKQAPLLAAGALIDTIEVAATWDRLRAVYRGMRSAIARKALVLAHFSHAYREGCSIYFTFAFPAPSFDAGKSDYLRIWEWALEACLAAGGTTTHHHGVGLVRRSFVARERARALVTLDAVRRAFDPAGIMNPGKSLPMGPPTAVVNGRAARK